MALIGFVVVGLVMLLATAAGADEVLSREANGDFVFDNGHYRVRLAKAHGFAGVEVRIHDGSGERLDQFFTPELTFHPMCRLFDNVSFMNPDGGEIQGYLTHENPYVAAESATVEGKPAVAIRGNLQRRDNWERGEIWFEKICVFGDSSYEVTLTVRVPEEARYRYADVWFDINDDWCDMYRNTAGIEMPLREGIAEADEEYLPLYGIGDMDRGGECWMAVSGPREEIRVEFTTPEVMKQYPLAGCTFFDGPTEESEAMAHQSHECMALSIIGGTAEYFEIDPAEFAVGYRVRFRGRK